jgi:hypothetical protein
MSNIHDDLIRDYIERNLKCDRCNGTGEIIETKYELDAIGKAMFPMLGKEGFCGYSDQMSRERMEQHNHPVEYKIRCLICGGSGIKYKNF